MILAAIVASSLIGVASAGQAQLPPTAKVSDDVCAIMLQVSCKVTDSSGQPVHGAEVKGKHYVAAGAGDFHLVGYSDPAGQLRSQFCYQSSHEYQSKPPNGRVTLEFLVSKPGYRDQQVMQQVSAADLLRDGLLLRQLEPYPAPKPAAADRARRVSLSVRLAK